MGDKYIEEGNEERALVATERDKQTDREKDRQTDRETERDTENLST